MDEYNYLSLSIKGIYKSENSISVELGLLYNKLYEYLISNKFPKKIVDALFNQDVTSTTTLDTVIGLLKK